MSAAVPKIKLTGDGKQSWMLGDDVIVECQATGNPKPEVRWLKQRERDGLFVPHKSSVYQNASHLVINDMKEDDFSLYRCEARNKMGVVVEDFSVGEYTFFNQTKD